MITRRSFVTSLLALPFVGKALGKSVAKPDQTLIPEKNSECWHGSVSDKTVNYNGQVYLFSSNHMYYVKDGNPPLRVWKADD